MTDSLNKTHQIKNTLSTRKISPSSMPTATLKKQAGMSFIGGFALMMMVAFVGLFALKVVPGYIEFMTVKGIAKDAQENSELMAQSKSRVNAYINQAYRTNNLWDLRAEDTVTLTKDSKKGYTVEVDYEKRSNLLSNIYVVTEFKQLAGEP